MFVYGGVVYAQKNFTGIDPEKLYRATFICQYGLCCCIVWPSFLFDCFVKIWATYKNFLGKWFTAPLAKNCPYAYAFWNAFFFFFFLLFQRCMTKRVCLSLSVFVNSLSIYSVFLKISLVKLDLSSRRFAFAFHDSILYP